LALNVLMLAGTPIDGSHYLTDVLAGGVIATFSLMAARKTVMRLTAAAPADSKLLRKPALGPSLGLTDEADLPRKAAAE
jgi:membrane-associated phospholipid phosphatase